jgi:predicted short-subunit dehydrogenase-like oxidoreductase (DUF2520 family)
MGGAFFFDLVKGVEKISSAFSAAFLLETTESKLSLALIYPIANFCANFIPQPLKGFLSLIKGYKSHLIKSEYKIMKVVLIGSGNAANVLGRKIIAAGHEIIMVFGRNEPVCAELGALLGCPFTINSEFIDRHADIYIAAIADNALADLHMQVKLGRKLTVHTAGAVSKDVLKEVSLNYGVLYPLQSLRKEITQLPEIPFLVDGNTPDNSTLIKDFAATLSPSVILADDAERKKLHVAAVFVNNFTNHLYSLAEGFCEKENIDFSLLFPLIKETALRVENFSPQQMQTGPAARGDTSTINMHLQILKQYPQLAAVYEQLSYSITSIKK